MDLYLPADFVPHADYAWSEFASDDGAPSVAEDWFGAEAYVAPSQCHIATPRYSDAELEWRTL